MSIDLRVRLLAGTKLDLGRDHLNLRLAPGATAADLARELARQGLDTTGGRVIILLNGRALNGLPPDAPLSPGDDVSVFNLVSGG